MIIAVDFDGVCHCGTYPAIGPVSIEAREALKGLKSRGHYIIIWTCRNGELLTQAINFLLDQKIPFDRINDQEPENASRYGDNSRKVYADVYIDDHNAGGMLSWYDIIEYIKSIEK